MSISLKFGWHHNLKSVFCLRAFLLLVQHYTYTIQMTTPAWVNCNSIQKLWTMSLGTSIDWHVVIFSSFAVTLWRKYVGYWYGKYVWWGFTWGWKSRVRMHGSSFGPVRHFKGNFLLSHLWLIKDTVSMSPGHLLTAQLYWCWFMYSLPILSHWNQNFGKHWRLQ